MKLLRIENRHITRAGYDWLLKKSETELPLSIMTTSSHYGFLINVQDMTNMFEDFNEMPESVSDVIEYADNEGARFLLIDEFGEVVPELTEYD